MQFTAEEFVPRTRVNQDAQYKRIEAAASSALGEHLSITYGIIRNPILNQYEQLLCMIVTTSECYLKLFPPFRLRYFHCVDGLPPDIMHDILEGALQYEAKLPMAAGSNIFYQDHIQVGKGTPYYTVQPITDLGWWSVTIATTQAVTTMPLAQQRAISPLFPDQSTISK